MAEKIIRGRIVKGIAGFYYVDADESGIIECHAKGIFRKEQVKPLVGDWVKLELLEQESKKGSIVEIEPRKNRLIRPDVANVDQALVVFAHASPQPNLNLLDKFLIMMARHDIPCILCFNKEDLVPEEERDRICEIYAKAGVRVISLQADSFSVDETAAIDDAAFEIQRQKDFAGMKQPIEKTSGMSLQAAAQEGFPPDYFETLKGVLDRKLTVLAGPSGVGKSTLVNSICPKAQMETGSISRKLERGKHTTRHSELFEIWEHSYLMDTPGFTAFELDADIEKEQLKDYYPEFYEYEGKCKFQGCSHTHEPGCVVKAAVKENRIHKIRYEGYVAIFEELKSRKKYDKKNYIKNT